MVKQTPFHPDAKPAPPPTRPEGLRPERHVLRGAEDYPMEEMEGTAYHIDRRDFPDGFDLQWVAVEVWQQPQPSMRAAFERKGWVPVVTGDFDGRFDGRFVPAAQQGEINLNGLVLCARPMAWSQKAKAIATRNAQSQVNIKVNQLRRGELDNVTLAPNHKSAVAFNHVTVENERVMVPAPAADK